MSDDSPKAGRATWIVPIVVAVIAALGVVIAAVGPSLLAPNDVPGPVQPATSIPAPSFAYSGMGTMSHPDPEVDLDMLPNGTGGDNIGDLVHTPMALATNKDSRIAFLDRVQPTPDICRSALATRGTEAIAVSQVGTGVRLCITTTAGRTGAIILDSVKKYGEPPQLRLGKINFSYQIWDIPAG